MSLASLTSTTTTATVPPHTLVATLPKGGVDSLQFDAITTEEVTNEATITDSPVEQGGDISDNIRQEPAVHRLEMIFSNTPLGQPAARGRAESARLRLKQWQALGALLQVPLTLGLGENLAIKSISAVRTVKNGGRPELLTGGLTIRLQLKHIRIVTNQLTTVTLSKDPRVAKKVPTGQQSTNATDENTDTALLQTLQGGANATGNQTLQRLIK